MCVCVCVCADCMCVPACVCICKCVLMHANVCARMSDMQVCCVLPLSLSDLKTDISLGRLCAGNSVVDFLFLPFAVLIIRSCLFFSPHHHWPVGTAMCFPPIWTEQSVMFVIFLTLFCVKGLSFDFDRGSPFHHLPTKFYTGL